jgi:hypothetical protein
MRKHAKLNKEQNSEQIKYVAPFTAVMNCLYPWFKTFIRYFAIIWCLSPCNDDVSKVLKLMILLCRQF